MGGIFVCAVAAIIWLGSADLVVGELRHFGPGFLPRILSAALMAGGFALVVRGVARPQAAGPLVLAARGPIAVGLAIAIFAIFTRGYSLGPVAVPQFGLLLVGPATVIVAGMGSVEADPRALAVLGVALSALATFLFTDLLSMQVPVFPAAIADGLPREWGQVWPRRIAVFVWFAVAAGLWRLFGLTFADLKERRAGEVRP